MNNNSDRINKQISDRFDLDNQIFISKNFIDNKQYAYNNLIDYSSINQNKVEDDLVSSKTSTSIEILNSTQFIDPFMHLTTPHVMPVKQNTAYNNSLYHSIYSNSGINVLSILMRITNRPNPQIDLGPIDTNCCMVIVDAKKDDLPIIYVNSEFEKLSLYKYEEVLGKNCRFLQAPGGYVTKNSTRKFVDNAEVRKMRRSIEECYEHQSTILNFKKNGESFMNFCTIIPLFDNKGLPELYVGFLVDLVKQPETITKNIKNGNYQFSLNMSEVNKDNYSVQNFQKQDINQTMIKDVVSLITGKNAQNDYLDMWCDIINENLDDLVYVMDLKGNFLYATPNTLKIITDSNFYDKGFKINISDLCHPADLKSFIRELRSCFDKNEFDLISRIKLNCQSYVYTHTVGTCIQGKNKRKYIYLSSRLFPISRLYKEIIERTSYIEDSDFWLRITRSSLILYSTSNVSSEIQYSNNEIVGSSIYSYIHQSSHVQFYEAFEKSLNDVTVKTKLYMQTKTGKKKLYQIYLYSNNNNFAFCQFKSLPNSNETDLIDEENIHIIDNDYNSVKSVLNIPQSNDIPLQVEIHKLKAENSNLLQKIKQLTQKRKR